MMRKKERREKNLAKKQSRSNRWIVLVDDDEEIRRSLGQYLFDQGYHQVTACPNAEVALNVCEEGRYNNQYQVPDLIVSDIRLGGDMDGIAFLRSIRREKRLQGIPVILLTAKIETKDRIKGYRAGADAYLAKPFDPEELLSIIDNSIRRFKTVTLQSGDPGDDDSLLVETMEQELKEIKSLLIGKDGNGLLDHHGWISTTNYPETGGNVFLTPDERRVLEHICDGLTNDQIYPLMACSKSRVVALVSILLRKTTLKNRTQLVRWAIATGQVDI